MRAEPADAARVLTLGEAARAALRAGRRGNLAAVFDRAAYARLGDDWLCVGEQGIGDGPLNVLCTAAAWFGAAPRIGDPVVCGTGTLHIGDALLLDWSQASSWRPHPAGDGCDHDLREGLAALDDLHREAPRADLGLACFVSPGATPTTPVARRAAAPVAALSDWLAAGGRAAEASEVAEPVTALLGLGPGLTPSGDDLLAGVLVALHRLGWQTSCDALWRLIEPRLAVATHPISAAHLRAAAAGGCAAALDGVLHALLQADRRTLSAGLATLATVGHSSGRDALAGVVIAARAMLAASRSLPPSRPRSVAGG